MSLSLRDQLLQAGLLSEKQAKQAARQPHHQRRERAEKSGAVVDEQKLAAQRAAEAKRLRDQEANRLQQEQIEKKARRAQIKQLVEQNRLPKIDSEELYNFIDGKKIRRIPADAARRDQLSRGVLMIVRCDGRYEVVPAAVADRIRERDVHAVIPHNPAQPQAVDENDPYKDYVVPDDLMW